MAQIIIFCAQKYHKIMKATNIVLNNFDVGEI
jgi:hypothetical protein